ncbi:Molecular chaperone HSP90 family-like [Desulfovibrio sp. DV]|uniref:HD domain-containing protein n=1 Tax=Desulfovibrio sp. DV TaxID=1844708 RepID=UPI00094B81B9|nr:ATP-binding protein [Desulfovibrio sp. DV]OLN30166.1 Molecular chaperone HSP90 family-like [Desulfovibrio sp. DV]
MKDDWHEEVELRLKKSSIYSQLLKQCADDQAGPHALALVKDAVFYAYQRTKTILRHMGEFTLHDGEHLFRVLNIMEKLLSVKNIEKLSTPDLMLLIIAAFFHDIGMSPDEELVLAWKKIWDTDPCFKNEIEELEFKNFKRFCLARPDRLEEISTQFTKGNISLSETLKSYIISDYIRINHNQRSREIIKKDWNSKIKYRDLDLTVELAEICFSHADDALNIVNLDKQIMCGSGFVASPQLIAIILRLSDLLDFDLKRTPPILFSHLAVRHPVSIQEWNKHRSIESWEINEKLISFHAKCTHPAIEAAIYSFFDIIDNELSVCNNILGDLNEYNSKSGESLIFKMPYKVDRSKVQTKRDVSGKPIYNFRETRFELSKKQVVDLLMGTKLYGEPSVALRELLQNSLDACLLRKSMEEAWGNSYTPIVEVKYYNEDGDFVLEVTDNGIGMDQHVIDCFYSKVGSSFYKSTDFYDLQAFTGSNFIPTSRFGIGILSCFMVADTILVDTRKLYGPHKSSDPISLIIEGEDSIFWVKDGSRETPGTQTKLILRKSLNPWGGMSESEFLSSVEQVIPNPPFTIQVQSNSQSKILDTSSFSNLHADSLKDYSWNQHDNVKEIKFNLDYPEEGLVGTAVVGLLEMHGLPVERIDVTAKEIEIEGESFSLEKTLSTSNNKIEFSSTSISIDDNGNIDSSSSTTALAHSKSRIALHGIEVAAPLFPDFWSRTKNQVSISWPFPILLIIDICGQRDIDLNSARDRFIMSDKWIKFEEDLAWLVCEKLSDSVSLEYWNALSDILSNSKNATFLSGFNRVNR